MANQGIMHLSATRGGRARCGNRKAHMSTTIEQAGSWSRICVRCVSSLKPAAREAFEASRTPKIEKEEVQ